MVLYDGATLLHPLREIDEVKLLFQAGFELINHWDNKGVTPLMRTVRLKMLLLSKHAYARVLRLISKTTRDGQYCIIFPRSYET
jgi:hypothetical protein